MTVLLGFAAIGVDLGWARYVKVELQHAADAGAHAGVLQLDLTTQGLTDANTFANTIAGDNYAAGSPVTLASGAVETGIWATDAFTPSTDPAQVNAVRVHSEIPALSLFFSPAAIRRTSVDVGATSIMWRPLQSTSDAYCYLPLAMPACLIGYHDGVSDMEEVTIALQPAGMDAVAWARPNAPANTSWSTSQINGQCSGGDAGVGDPVYLQNGAAISALSALASAINNSSTTWSTSKWGTLPTRPTNSSITVPHWGHTFEGPIMLFDGGPEYCMPGGGSYTGSYPITGFMWAAVYDVVNTGSVADRTIKLRLDPMTDHEISGIGSSSGPDYGLQSLGQPRMVPP
jgi:hypothetical protein